MTPLSAAARRRRGTLGPGHLSHRGEHSAPASPGRPARRPPRGSRQKAPGVQRRRSLQGPAVKQNERRKARAREPELPPLDDRIQIPGGLSAAALRGGRPPRPTAPLPGQPHTLRSAAPPPCRLHSPYVAPATWLWPGNVRAQRAVAVQGPGSPALLSPGATRC